MQILGEFPEQARSVQGSDLKSASVFFSCMLCGRGKQYSAVTVQNTVEEHT